MITFLLISVIVLGLVLAVIGFLLLGVLQAVARMAWRLDQVEAITPSRIGRGGLNPGKRAPDFALPSVAGDVISLGSFAGHKVLLVFVQTGCGPCHDIAPELNRLAARNRDLRVLVVNNAELEQARLYAREVNARFPVLVQEKWSVSKGYEVFATPFAFLIDEQGVIAAKGIVSSRKHLGFLLSSATSPRVAKGESVAGQGPAESKVTHRGTLSESVSHSPKEVQHV
jgi:methylamine dehydrogenase accessory protein MauD